MAILQNYLAGAASLLILAQAFFVQASVLQTLASPPSRWTRHTPAIPVDKSTSSIKLWISLKVPRMEEFKELALKIATPGHEMYGQHLSKTDMAEMLAPKTESVDAVLNWLDEQGLLEKTSLENEFVVVNASIDDAEKLLAADYQPYVDESSKEVVWRTLQYSLPKSVKEHIDVVQPTTYFGMRSLKPSVKLGVPAKSARIGKRGSPCHPGTINPSCLVNLYNLTDAEHYTTGRMGITAFLGEDASPQDLKQFNQDFGAAQNRDLGFGCVSINNGRCDGRGTAEANLDTQYARALTQRVPNIVYSTSGHPPAIGDVNNEPYLELLNYLLGLDDAELPSTLTNSYDDDESSVPKDYAMKVCDLFAKLGARGVSIFTASGDSGVAGCPNDKFTPGFPASCPWVTTVGGTSGTYYEAAWGYSGGGFSNYFAQPSYQKAAVGNWTANDPNHSGHGSYFNASGRAYPDVGANAENFEMIIRGDAAAVSGTSASTPVFAAIVQLLNSDRLSKGKKPLGFLNPWIYSVGAKGLNDITLGINIGCNNTSGQDVPGFNTAVGWDPVTGLGTPNFGKLLTIARDTAV